MAADSEEERRSRKGGVRFSAPLSRAQLLMVGVLGEAPDAPDTGVASLAGTKAY